jgi:hypothetical protein
LLEKSAETRGGVGLIAEESAGDQEEVHEEVERDGGVTDGGSGISCGTFVEVQEDFADGAEIEAVGETLCGEGVVEEGGEPEVEANGKEEGQGQVERVGPQERG